MIYLASRSAWKYLRKLQEISLRQREYHIVSITGGLASLHAVGNKTRSLVFVDSDPEVNEYGKCMIEAIRCCPTRGDFFELLSGRKVGADESGKVLFLRSKSSKRDHILTTLSPHTSSCISRWYIPDSFDDETATMTAEDKTVHFFGLSLQIQHFNWHADWGAFHSEESYRALFEALKRVSPSFYTLPLEEYDFSNCPPDTLILASNTDSPLFTQRDVVLRAIETSGSKNCAYVSRSRDFSISPPEATNLGSKQFQMPPVLVGVPDNLVEVIRELLPPKYTSIQYPQYYGRLFYDEELILFWGAERTSAERSALLDHLQVHQPIHQRIGVITPRGEDDTKNLTDILKRYIFQEVLHVGHFEVTLFSLAFRTPY